MATTEVKLNPTNYAKISFPGWQLVSSFTSAGAESSLAVTVAGDTDKEYWVYVSNKASSNSIFVRLNNDSGTNYGYQYVDNNAGTITASRGTLSGLWTANTEFFMFLQCPTSLLKEATIQYFKYSTGTTISFSGSLNAVYNSTSNITSINFVSASGNFTSGTRITVYARRA